VGEPELKQGKKTTDSFNFTMKPEAEATLRAFLFLDLENYKNFADLSTLLKNYFTAFDDKLGRWVHYSLSYRVI
jgi:hypothetical protein